VNNDILTQLVALSNQLGRPENDYVILGEGNTSARADAESFYVKASGTELRTITASGFVHVSFQRVLALMERQDLSDADVKAGLIAAKMDPTYPSHPSVETLLHGLCLNLPGINFVGHTHPVAVNSVTCSAAFDNAFAGRLFPDEIVLCGPAPVTVPYTDPGVPLARETYGRIQTYIQEHNDLPRIILIQNHGLIVLGKTAQQVADTTAMAVKTARILVGTYAAGGPRFLSPKDVARIHTRPDELYRREKLGI